MITNLLNTIALSAASFGQGPQPNGNQPQVRGGGNDFVIIRTPRLLNDAQINTALSNLDSGNFQTRNTALADIRLHMQELSNAGQINDLGTFIQRLQGIQTTPPSLEVRRGVELLLNSSALLSNFNNIPVNRQRAFLRTLANTGIISEDIVSRDPNARAAAATRESDPRILAILARDRNPSVRMNVAANLNTFPADLTILARERNLFVRMSVAANPNTLPTSLTRLSMAPESSVRMNVAANPRTLPTDLTRLAGDQDPSVRVFVAVNPNTLPVDITRLAGDLNPNVRMFAVTAQAALEERRVNPGVGEGEAG